MNVFNVKKSLLRFARDWSLYLSTSYFGYSILQEAACNDYIHCFKKGFNFEKNMEILCSESSTLVDSLLNFASINKSVRVIRYMAGWRSFRLVSWQVYSRAVCRALTDSETPESREIFDILWFDCFCGKPCSRLMWYCKLDYDLEKEIRHGFIQAAARSSSRWGLDMLHKESEKEFDNLSSDYLLQHIRDNNIEMVSAMLEYGFDIHIENDAALAVASRNCDHEMISLLLKYRADISGHGYKALRKAIIYGDAEVMRMYTVTVWNALESDVPLDLAIKFIRKVLTFDKIAVNQEELMRKLRKLSKRKEEEVG